MQATAHKNKAHLSGLKYSAPRGRVMLSRQVDTGTAKNAPSRSSRQYKRSPPEYMTQADRIKKANEFLRVWFGGS